MFHRLVSFSRLQGKVAERWSRAQSRSQRRPTAGQAASATAPSTLAPTAETQPPPAHAWRPFRQLRERGVGFFVLMAAILDVLQSPLAWLAWACTAYFVAGCAAVMIVCRARAETPQRLALVMVTSLLMTVVGTWVAWGGFNPRGGDSASKFDAARKLEQSNRILAGRLEADLRSPVRVVTVEAAPVVPLVVVKTTVKLRVSGTHASASSVTEDLPLKAAPAATVATVASRTPHEQGPQIGGVAAPATPGAPATMPTMASAPATTPATGAWPTTTAPTSESPTTTPTSESPTTTTPTQTSPAATPNSGATPTTDTTPATCAIEDRTTATKPGPASLDPSSRTTVGVCRAGSK
jgi:hypothetical protein